MKTLVFEEGRAFLEELIDFPGALHSLQEIFIFSPKSAYFSPDSLENINKKILIAFQFSRAVCKLNFPNAIQIPVNHIPFI